MDSSYWLVSFEEVERWVDDGDLSGKRDVVEKIIDQSSALIESQIHRKFVTRGSLTEYHTFTDSDYELFTLEWPIISVTSIHEDISREYNSDDLLTENTDYIVNKPKGKIIRTWSATEGERAWQIGFRAIKIVYSAGYANTDAVESDIKDVCLRHVGMVWREITRKLGNVESVSDAMGSFARYGPAALTTLMMRDLYPHIDEGRGHYTTGERDS